MKTLFIVRHGEAVTRELDIPDYGRPLADRGIFDSHITAQHLRNTGVKVSLIVSSPAPRALQTANLFAQYLNYSKNKIRKRKAIYEQTENALIRIIHSVDNAHKSLMLVGHNPSFTELARFLVETFDQDIPTSGTVGVDLPIDSWKDVTQGIGKLKLFEYPMDLKKKFEDGKIWLDSSTPFFQKWT